MPAPVVTARVPSWTAAALLVATLVLHAWALAHRSGPPTDDEARHLLLAAAVRDLPRQPPSRWLDLLYAAAGAQPPAHHLTMGAGFLALGESARVAWGVQLAVLAAAVIATWRFAHALMGPATAATAAVVFATLPGVTRVARTARPEVAGALIVALVLALLAVRRPGRAATAGLGVLLGVGALTLWSFPLFVSGPLLAAGLSAQAPGGWTRRQLVTAAALGLVMALPWWTDFVLHRVPAQGVLVGLGAAPADPRVPRSALFWARSIVDHHLSGPLRLVFLPALLVTAWRLRTAWGLVMGPRPDLRDWPAEALVGQMAGRASVRAPRASLLLVPDHATLNPLTLAWLARQRGLHLSTTRLPDQGPTPDARALDYVLVNAKGEQDAAHVSERQARATAELLHGGGLVPVADLPSPVGPLTLLRSQAKMPVAVILDLTRGSAHEHLGEA